MTDSLKGKVALVTGGSRGLGAVIAEALAAKGADVAISYETSVGKAEAVADKLRAKGVRALAIRSDQADLTAAASLIGTVSAYFGRLDILVNNAAISVQGQSVDDPELDTESLDRQWRINVLGTVAVTRAASSALSDGGRIIFIGSALGGRVAFPGVADYAGTKAAVVGYAKGVGRDLGPRNITVNVIQPGIIATDINEPLPMSVGMIRGETDDAPSRIMDLHALRRVATVEEVAASVCFLAGPDSGYMTGSVLDISGGYQI